MKLNFHSWLKSTIGHDSEEIILPNEVKTVGDLATHLAARHENAASVFEVPEALRYVIDRRYVTPDHELGDAASVDIYPPVTGG